MTKNIFKGLGFKCDLTEFNTATYKLEKRLPDRVMKAMSEVAGPMTQDIRNETSRQIRSQSNAPTVGGRKPDKFLNGITRWKYQAKSRGKYLPRIRFGVFPGKAQGGSVLRSKDFKKRYGLTLAGIVKAYRAGGMRITPTIRRARMELSRRNRSIKPYKKSTRVLKYPKVNWDGFIRGREASWRKHLKQSIDKRVKKLWKKG